MSEDKYGGKGGAYVDVNLSTKPKKSTHERIQLFGIEFIKYLQSKNKKYGDSALHPLKIFSKFECLKDTDLGSRMDDKISRVNNSDVLRKNDVTDMLGYLTLICLHMEWDDLSDQID